MRDRTRPYSLSLAILTMVLLTGGVCMAQNPAPVPTMVKFSGTVHEAPSRIVGITFTLYKDEQGGAPLWMETQSVPLDSGGRYTVQLGSTLPAGLPKELFASGEARWLGITPEGQQEQTRVLLLSVPYALKAADAETIGGLPASAFVLKGPEVSPALPVTKKNAKVLSPNTPPPPGSLNVTTAGGTVNVLSLFSTSTDIENSVVTQLGSSIGINTPTPATTLDVNGNATVRGIVNATSSYQLGGNYWGFGNYNLGNSFDGFGGNPFSPGGQQNTAMGANALSAASNSGQQNTAVGYWALLSDTSGYGNTSVGSLSLYRNTTGFRNTAVGLAALDTTSTGSQNTAIGYSSLSANTTGSSNTAVGTETLEHNTTGTALTAVGEFALVNSTGNNNTGLGAQVLQDTTTGTDNAAVGFGSLFWNTTGSFNTAIGSNAGTDRSTPNLTNATAIGANANVSASNSMVLGSIAGVNFATADTNVGIGVTAPVAKLHIGSPSNSAGTISLRIEGPSRVGTGGNAISIGGYGDFGIDKPYVPEGRFVVKENGLVGINTAAPDAALSVNGNADKPGGGSWLAFSDRRLKDLDGDFSLGLTQIMKINPVRYRYKDKNGMEIQDGSEHIGLVAQDVQKVIPEAVTQNNKGYLLINNDPIIWAMLNAIKEQQRQIRKERSLVRAQQAAIHELQSQLKETRQSLATMKTKMDTSQEAVLGSR